MKTAKNGAFTSRPREPNLRPQIRRRRRRCHDSQILISCDVAEFARIPSRPKRNSGEFRYRGQIGSVRRISHHSLSSELNTYSLAALDVDRGGFRFLLVGAGVWPAFQDVPARRDILEGHLVLVVDVSRSAVRSHLVAALRRHVHDVTALPRVG